MRLLLVKDFCFRYHRYHQLKLFFWVRLVQTTLTTTTGTTATTAHGMRFYQYNNRKILQKSCI